MALIVQNPLIQGQKAQATTKQEMPIGDSKFLQHVAYDPAAMQMTVTMKTGAQYIYFMVFPTVMEQWMQARSKGEFYAKQVRGKLKASRTIAKGTGKKISQTGKITGRPHG
jgi:hypothetical protein